MIEIDEARALVAERAQALGAVERALEDAAGSHLAAAVEALVELPPGDVSAMDGYALRSGDVAAGIALPVAFVVAAGTSAPELPPRRAARIFTGALVPDGADAVVPQEQVRQSDDGCIHAEPVAVGAHIRRRGEIVAAGTVLASPGQRLTPARLGLLAAGGITRVRIHRRPTLAALLTGAELRASGEPLDAGQIRDSNGPMLRALAASADLALTSCETAIDDEDAIAEALSRSLESADLVLTTGGVSVGDYDLVPVAVERLGGETLFHGVRMKPGKPTLIARLGERWVVGLPGNPLAVLTAWHLFVRPLAGALGGDRTAFADPRRRGILEDDVGNAGGRTVFRPARWRWTPEGTLVRALPWKGSHDLSAAAPANALLRIEPGEALDAGAEAPFYPI